MLIATDPAVEDPSRTCWHHPSTVSVLWRAGHAHAGVLLLLSLVVLRYADEADLTARLKGFVRSAAPSAAILMPAGFFLSVLESDATAPNGLIVLTYLGAAVLAAGIFILGIGLLRGRRSVS